MPRSEAVRAARERPLVTAVFGLFWHGRGTPPGCKLPARATTGPTSAAASGPASGRSGRSSCLREQVMDRGVAFPGADRQAALGTVRARSLGGHVGWDAAAWPPGCRSPVPGRDPVTSNYVRATGLADLFAEATTTFPGRAPWQISAPHRRETRLSATVYVPALRAEADRRSVRARAHASLGRADVPAGVPGVGHRPVTTVTVWRYRAASDLRASWTGRYRGPGGQSVPSGLVRAIPAGRQAELGAARATRTLTWAIVVSTENETAEFT